MESLFKQIRLANIEHSMTSQCQTVRHATWRNMEDEKSKQNFIKAKRPHTKKKGQVYPAEVEQFHNGNAIIYLF